MSLRAKTFLLFLAGILGGMLAWMAVGRTGWLTWTSAVPGFPIVTGKQLAIHRAEVGAVASVLIGLLLGVADSFSFDRALDRVRAVALTCLIAALTGALALQIGPLAPATGMGLDNPVPGTAAPLAAAQAMAAQGIVWAVVGLGFGVSHGLLWKSALLVKQGAFGGVLGGLASGAATRLLPPLNSTILPGMASLPTFVIAAGLIGLGIGLATYLFRIGSILIVEGSRAGKEYVIGSPLTLVGSGLNCDVPLLGDANIALQQCSIEENHEQVAIRNLTGEDRRWRPTLLNSKRLSGVAALHSGDYIVIGDYRLQFLGRIGDDAGANAAAPAPTAAAGDITEPVRVAPQKVSRPKDADRETTDRIPVAAPESVGLYRRQEGARLVCVGGPYKGDLYALGVAKRTTLGRGADRNVALVNDHAASRDHAVVLLANGIHVIRDDGSANGTLLNGLRLQSHTPHRLSAQDVIVIGRTVLRYED